MPSHLSKVNVPLIRLPFIPPADSNEGPVEDWCAAYGVGSRLLRRWSQLGIKATRSKRSAFEQETRRAAHEARAAGPKAESGLVLGGGKSQLQRSVKGSKWLGRSRNAARGRRLPSRENRHRFATRLRGGIAGVGTGSEFERGLCPPVPLRTAIVESLTRQIRQPGKGLSDVFGPAAGKGCFGAIASLK